jgi:hypothetical protein
MTNASLQDLLAATGFAYIQSDVPPGVTLDEWRRARNLARPERRRPLVASLRHRIGRR